MPSANVNQNPEQIARDQIDARLVAAGWHVQDKAKINFNIGRGIAVREYPTDIGPADYVLFVDRRAVGVIEAKPEDWGHKITVVEEQADGYAAANLKWVNNREPLPFVYQSTGVITRFTDGRDPHPRSREVFTFHRPETMAEWLSQPLSLRSRLQTISIAAFFAELSTADDPSAIVFDDPVSSLDFEWRSNVAKRLVQESTKRQVIVFTHDVVFLLALKKFADDSNIQSLDQHVRRQALSAGVCAEELPWFAMPVNGRIGYLKNRWQAVDKLHRDGNQDAYDEQAKAIYGRLREAWERALEEVLLNGVVQRYRPSIETQRLGKIFAITEADYKSVEAGMAKSSAWLIGHDRAAAARAPVPGPTELKKDIDALEIWVKSIRDRRR